MHINIGANQSLNTDSSWVPKYFNKKRHRIQVGQSPQLVANNTVFCLSSWRISLGCRESQSLWRRCVFYNGSLVWPLGSSEGKTLAFHPSACAYATLLQSWCIRWFSCWKSSQQSISVCTVSSQHSSSGAPEDTLLGSHSCPFCLEVMPVNALWVYFFLAEEIKNCKEPSGQKWPMQWWKHSSGRYIRQRRKILNLVTLMSHLVYRRFSSLVESAGEPAPQRQAPLGWSALSAS